MILFFYHYGLFLFVYHSIFYLKPCHLKTMVFQKLFYSISIIIFYVMMIYSTLQMKRDSFDFPMLTPVKREN